MISERYLCRAKRLDTGEWVTGNYVTYCGKPCIYREIMDEDSFIREKYWFYDVDPATVGRCTGREDKNGKLIFEGDILSCPIIRNGGQTSNWEREINKNHGKKFNIYMKVTWKQVDKMSGLGAWKFGKVPGITDRQIYKIETPIGLERTRQNVNYLNIKPSECEIVGNIYDKLELMEVAEC